MTTTQLRLTGARHRSDPDDGVEGNAILTGVTGALLILPLAVEGVTILRIGQLLWLHMFIGMMLSGLFGLKLASTGYKFTGYYTGRAAYVRKGPPVTPLRLLAIPVVLGTIGVMATGILLLLEGPASRGRMLLLHKGFFILWLIATGIHVLAHLLDSQDAVAAEFGQLETGTPRVSRRGARLLLIGTALAIGVVIAVIALPDFGAWQHYYTYFHGDH
jgi:hypothetical protein